MSKLSKKIAVWEKNLLDLGKRNKMINYRETKRSTLTLTSPGYASLYNSLVNDERRLTFQYPVGEESDRRVYAMLSLMQKLGHPLIFMHGDIATDKVLPERNAALKNMRSKARLAQEEQGINILYLSLGLLEWQEGGIGGRVMRSPLVLVPMRLILESVRAPYVLEKGDDEIVSNPALTQLFKQNYNLELPQFDVDGESLEEFLERVDRFAQPKGWQVIRSVSLGLMSFLKISMYRDLQNNRDRILCNPVLQALAGDREDLHAAEQQLCGFDHDAIPAEMRYQVINADSSQQDAIELSRRGISFVLQGPPGTGKSQTITNIIAQGFADGKKILFVSEKMAALQVVYKRLQDVGLADFCLPLHSHKASKVEILNEITHTLDMKRIAVKKDALASLGEIDCLRNALNSYPQVLHLCCTPLDCSVYEAIGELARLEGIPEIDQPFENAMNMESNALEESLRVLDAFAHVCRRYDAEPNPWEGFVGHCPMLKARMQLQSSLEVVASGVDVLIDACGKFIKKGVLNADVTWAEAKGFREWCVDACRLEKVTPYTIDGQNAQSLFREIGDARTLQRKYREDRQAAAHLLPYGREDIDSSAWLAQYGTLRDALRKRIRLPGNWIDALPEEIGRWEDQRRLTADLQRRSKDLSEMFGLSLHRCSDAELALQCSAALSACKAFPEAFFDAVEMQRWMKLLPELREQCGGLCEKRRALLADWEDGVLAIAYAPILDRFKEEYTSFFKLFKREYREDRRQIARLSRQAVKMSDAECVELLQKIRAYQETFASWIQKIAPFAQILGPLYQGLDTDWAAAETVANAFARMHALGLSPEWLRQMRCAASADKGLPAKNAAFNATPWLERYSVFAARLDEYGLGKEGEWASAVETAESICRSLAEIEALVHSAGARCVPGLPNFEIVRTFEADRDMRIAEKNAARDAQQHLEHFGTICSGLETDWDAVEQIASQAQQLAARADALRLPREFVVRALCLRDEDAAMAALCGATESFMASVEQGVEELRGKFDESHVPHALSLTRLRRWVHFLLARPALLELWVEYRDMRLDPSLGRFEGFEKRAREARVDYDQWAAAARKAFYIAWLDGVLAEAPELAGFDTDKHARRILRFCELDGKQFPIARDRIRAQLIASMPSNDRPVLSSRDELAILRHEQSKRRAHMPLRKLFAQIPNLLLTLKPCFMMSPLSVAHFLEAETYSFDMVIFDEASQIMPEDAVGALLRGKQVIIAGDTRQMPPTNFFAVTTSDSEYDVEEDEEEDDDPVSESILEESERALPNCSLLWHYRSRHENLIAFSNSEIYDNRLVTFPCNWEEAPNLGVEYVHVPDGTYAARQNLREAQRCIELLEEHIHLRPERSLGIVAFSESQQSLIEDLAWTFRQEHPQYEPFFDETLDSPFFVKNLENIQGDERDTIIFSIGYAKRADGARMSLNFGPLSKAGGERRLNVAITRAKYNVKLVGSIEPTDIDLERARSEGARLLRAYLEYAVKGKSSLMNPRVRRTEGTSEDAFIAHCADFLTNRGYAVRRNVGQSDYTVDIAVEHPCKPGFYVLGVECDGEDYAQARTARDRDHLRPSVLKNLGWKIYRIWAADWLRNSEAAEAALLATVEDAMSDADEPKGQEKTVENQAIETYVEMAVPSQDVPQEIVLADYHEADPWHAHLHGTSNRAVRLRMQLTYVVEKEQPIHLDLLYRRLASPLGYAKACPSVRSEVDECIRQLVGKEIEVQNNFVHQKGFAITQPRKAGNRTADMISHEELSLVFMVVVENSIGLAREALFAEAARLLGFERQGARITQAFDRCYAKMILEKKLREIDGKVQMLAA